MAIFTPALNLESTSEIVTILVKSDVVRDTEHVKGRERIKRTHIGS